MSSAAALPLLLNKPKKPKLPVIKPPPPAPDVESLVDSKKKVRKRKKQANSREDSLLAGNSNLNPLNQKSLLGL